jgi:hypothetical protein
MPITIRHNTNPFLMGAGAWLSGYGSGQGQFGQQLAQDYRMLENNNSAMQRQMAGQTFGLLSNMALQGMEYQQRVEMANTAHNNALALMDKQYGLSGRNAIDVAATQKYGMPYFGEQGLEGAYQRYTQTVNGPPVDFGTFREQLIQQRQQAAVTTEMQAKGYAFGTPEWNDDRIMEVEQQLGQLDTRVSSGEFTPQQADYVRQRLQTQREQLAQPQWYKPAPKTPEPKEIRPGIWQTQDSRGGYKITNTNPRGAQGKADSGEIKPPAPDAPPEAWQAYADYNQKLTAARTTRLPDGGMLITQPDEKIDYKPPAKQEADGRKDLKNEWQGLYDDYLGAMTKAKPPTDDGKAGGGPGKGFYEMHLDAEKFANEEIQKRYGVQRDQGARPAQDAQPVSSEQIKALEEATRSPNPQKAAAARAMLQQLRG